MKIVIAGTMVGILPFLIVTVVRQFAVAAGVLWEMVAVGALAFISISFGYAILKHGAIELNVVLRKSLAPAFVTGAIIGLYYAVVNLLGDFFTKDLRLAPTFFSLLSIVVIAILFAPAREFFQRVMDRTLFRDEYDYREQVVGFYEQLSTMLTKSDMLDHFFDKVEALLKPSHIVSYSKRSNGLLECEKQAGEAPAPADGFVKSSRLGQYLALSRKPLMVEYLDHFWKRRHLDGDSRVFLSGSRAAVCLPVLSHDKFLALILLGPKRSGSPYTRLDAALLEGLAERLGMVLDNVELHEATIEQERLKGEVLLARDIQMSLLPKCPPTHPTLDVQGKMISCEEIGGDFYDYFYLDEQRIGVAIGDVSGKGIPAAMLMASLQAVFKNLAKDNRMAPAELIAELNKYMCSNVQRGKFATFLYGIFDLTDSTFTFSNAGQHPALLVRNDYVDRLGEGGLPLGVDADWDYEEGRVRIGAGEILSFHTDGILEQKSPSGGDFGEDGLVTFLQANRNLPLPQLHDLLFASLRQFGGGDLNDDATSIIARRKGA